MLKHDPMSGEQCSHKWAKQLDEIALKLLYSSVNASKYCSRALKSRSKLRAALGLRAAFGIFYYIKKSLFTVTFGEKVLSLAKSSGS